MPGREEGEEGGGRGACGALYVHMRGLIQGGRGRYSTFFQEEAPPLFEVLNIFIYFSWCCVAHC